MQLYLAYATPFGVVSEWNIGGVDLCALQGDVVGPTQQVEHVPKVAVNQAWDLVFGNEVSEVSLQELNKSHDQSKCSYHLAWIVLVLASIAL